jgi:hypothetical protein
LPIALNNINSQKYRMCQFYLHLPVLLLHFVSIHFIGTHIVFDWTVLALIGGSLYTKWVALDSKV